VAVAGKSGVKLQINEAELKAQIKKQREMLNKMGSQTEVARAQAAALNKGAARINTLLVRGVSKSLMLKQQLIRDKMRVKKANARQQEATVTGKTGGISLMNLKPKEVGGGVQAGKYLVPNAFITTTKKNPAGSTKGRKDPSGQLIGKTQVFKRKGGSRYPLQAQSVNIRPQMRSQIKQHADHVARHEMARLLLHEYNFRIKQKLGQ
jgi:hypothetical protein